VSNLRDRGALGILFFSNEELNLSSKIESSATSIPVVQISRAASIKMEKFIGRKVSLIADVKVVKGISYNVVMHLDQSEKKEFILLGAHYDHLGMGGQGSGSMRPKEIKIHNGADDNASGVALMLEAGRILASKRDDFKRDVVLVAFGGEERGLLGSNIIADTLKKMNLNPLVMFNLDMVGRLVDNKLQVGGVGTFAQADSIISEVNKSYNFSLSKTKDGYGPSDHSSFYTREVPVLYFTTGVHPQYHTPDDDINLINFTGLAKITEFISNLAIEVLSCNQLPKYIKLAAPVTQTRSNFKVTLGLIPDFTYEEGDGFRTGSVSEGKPAQKGGMLSGDIIIAINSKKVSNIYDYMSRLGELKKGDKIVVQVRRGEEVLNLYIQL
jgi:hypothetical protein